MPAIFLSLILASTSLAASLGGGNEWDLTLCKERGNHWRNNQHNYLYSGLLGQVGGTSSRVLCLFLQRNAKEARRLEWSEARRFCRSRCMDLISLETPWEHRLLARKMKELGAGSVWTSGHLCDHQVSERSVSSLLPPSSHHSALFSDVQMLL